VAAQPPIRHQTAISDRLLFCQRRMANGYTYLVLDLDRRLDVDRLRRAIRLTVDVLPLLSCRFVDHWFRPYWQRRDDVDQVEWLHVTHGAGIEDEINALVEQRRDPCVDPVFSVRLFRGEADVFCLEVCNILTDGGGASILLSTISSIYDELARDPNHVPPPCRPQDRDYRSVIRAMSRSERRTILKNLWELARLVRGAGRWEFPQPEAGADKSFLITETLGAEACRRLSRYGRRHKASLNLILLTAVYRALRAEFPTSHAKPLPIMMPISFRPYFPEATEGVMTHFVGGTCFLGEGAVDEPFESTLEHFYRQFKDRGRRYLGMVSPAFTIECLPPVRLAFEALPFSLLKRLVQARMSRVARPPGPGLAVLTCLEVDARKIRFGDATAQSLFASGNVPRVPGAAGFAAVRLADRLILSTGGFESCLPPDRIRSALSRLIADLPVG
jgi:NRPS condensation-like uncharacterized protein